MGIKVGWFVLKKICKKINIYLQKKRVAQFIKNRNEKIKKFVIPETNLSNETIQKVLNSDITELKRMLHSRTVTSEDLVNIFAKRCQ